MDSTDHAAVEELAEVKQLQQQQLTSRIGIPNLQIDELQGKLQLVFQLIKYCTPPHMQIKLRSLLVSSTKCVS